MLTRKQADDLMQQFKRATEYVWDEYLRELKPSPIAFEVIENIISEYTGGAAEELANGLE